MASSTTRPTSQEGFAIRKLVWVGPLTILVAVLFNLVIRTIAVAFFGVSAGFTYLQAPFVIGSTVVFLLLALVALVVSFLNPVMALVGLFPAPGMNLPTFWTMIVMHTVTAVITVSLLTRLTVEPER